MPSPAQRLRQTLSKRIVMAMENSERGTRMRQFLFDTDVRPVVECIERSNALAREVGSSTIDSFAPCDVVALARTMVRHRVRDKSLWVAVREAAALLHLSEADIKVSVHRGLKTLAMKMRD